MNTLRLHNLLLIALMITLSIVAISGCSPARYRDSADRETYGILNAKSTDLPGMEEDFSIEPERGWTPLEGLPANSEIDPALGPQGESERDAQILSLEQALNIAVRNSRAYQNRKESLYLQALSLTLERHRYTPIFSGSLSGDYVHSTRDVVHPSDFTEALNSADGILSSFRELTGTPAGLLEQYAALVREAGELAGFDQPRLDIVSEESVTGQTSAGVNVLLRGGGRIALNLTSNFLRFLTGDSRTATSSALTATVTQPLLRGAGADIAAERLTQAERDTLYALRDFTQFRKEFVVTICTQYYQVLQNKDVLRNTWQSYQNFQQAVERERALTTEGRRTQGDLGRFVQAQYNAENTWINAIRRYKEQLDQFKIQLGLSTDAEIILDDLEMDQLREIGLQHPEISPEDAVQVALAARLDYYNAKDRTYDAERRVKVAANALKPGLDLILAGRVDSTGQDNFQELDFQRARWNAGFDADLPLDRKAERNAYRAALIAYERALRDFSLEEDNVKFEVRASWRNLEQARRNYEIALQSVQLNERRVEEQALLAELGRATALNQVDAQNDLTDSQNRLTDALVSHTIARLQFWRDMGILYVKKDGQWEEVNDAF